MNAWHLLRATGLLVWLLWGGTAYLPAQSEEARTFNQEALEGYRADPAYAYGLEPIPDAPEPPRPLNPLWLTLWKGFMYVVIGGVLILLVYMVLARTLLRPSRRVAGASELPEMRVEDLRDLPYVELIAEAEAAGDYRRSVRLLFLQTLRELHAGNWIDWRDNKTNQDYYYQLYDTPLRDGFEALALAYDYIWYGHFDLDAGRYAGLRQRFSTFQSRLHRHETA